MCLMRPGSDSAAAIDRVVQRDQAKLRARASRKQESSVENLVRRCDQILKCSRAICNPCASLNNAAVGAQRRHVTWLVEEPDAFPLIEKCAQVFGRVN